MYYLGQTIKKCFDPQNTRYLIKDRKINLQQFKSNHILNVQKIFMTIESLTIIPVVIEIIE